MKLEIDNQAVTLRPLTRSQLMIWTGQRLQKNEPLYNMALSFRLGGAINGEVFQLAHDQLVANCDALRTTFIEINGVPKQRFHEHYKYQVEIVDLSENKNPEKALMAWQESRAQQIFDLSACLFDSCLVKLSADSFVWFFNQHHLTTDAWSTSLIYKTQQHYYALVKQDRLVEAEVLPDYQQYISYEQDQQDSKRMRSAQKYWTKELRDATPASEFYRATPKDRTGRTRRVACEINADQSAAIKQLAQVAGFQALTDDLSRFQIFATLLFAWLYRVTGNTQLSIGTPSHSRGTAKQKNTVGMFIEIYPLLIDIDDSDTFASLYSKVARKTQYMLINAVPGGSGFEHNRAYDVLLNYITVSFGDFEKTSMESNWVHAGFGDRNHLVRMQVEDFDSLDRFRVFFDVNEDTFVGREQDRPGQEFLALVDALIKNPDALVASVNMLDDQQRDKLSSGFASPHSMLSNRLDTADDTLIDQIIRQARKSPDAVALVLASDHGSNGASKGFLSDKQAKATDTEVTYSQLLDLVQQIGVQLDERNITAADRVGIMLPRSIEAVVAILAVMHRGAVYVPIDDSYPQERIAFMLADAGAKYVIGNPQHFVGDAKRIEVSLTPSAAASKDSLPLPRSSPEGAAYVLYTSGSTGQPKGVDVGHAGLSNYVNWAAAYYVDNQSLNWPLFTSLAFDLTITSLFVPLITGGQLVIYGRQENQSDILVRKVIEDNRVDAIKLTPAHLALIQAMDLSQSKLRKVIVGGEDFKVGLAQSVDDYFGGKAALYNEYGPTEGTVACMIHRFDRHNDIGQSVPIGRAIDNAQIYILNDAHQVQPQGIVGELYIGGVGVARGYLHQPELTQERFIDHPLNQQGKLYRTGDLARLDEHGNIVYQGRRDEQVKVNGVRIELGDIEATLLKHPSISHASARLIDYQAQDRHTDEEFCIRCGLSGLHPSSMLDEHNVCKICHVYEAERDRALAYFGTPADLQLIVKQIEQQRSDSSPDDPNCLMLLSGGKDSTFALCQIVDLGLKPLVFTLDNGFISEGAKANMRRVVDHLGLELIEGSTPAMNEIFRDSLQRFSNVCNGCFKTIYTLSMKIAQERGIRHIFTGLSRGQIFETRVADLFRQRVFDNSRIDALIVEARKAYHQAEDAVSNALDTKHFEDESIFERIQYVDYYRYTDVSLGEMLTYLRDRVPWVRPADTGRSTNCLINEAGIFVHKKERGFHNYSLPYSWDVRLGHKERDAAREELDDNINLDNVNKILSDVAYTPRELNAITESRKVLVGYYVSDDELSAESLTEHLASHLPDDYVPDQFVKMASLPLTSNGKVDRKALPHPELVRPDLEQDYVAASSQVETVLAKIWARVFGVDRVGVNDNFFELGGDSIVNIQIVSLAAKEGVLLSPQQVFDYPTIAQLQSVVGTAQQLASEQGVVSGAVELTPIQHRYFEQARQDRYQYAQAVCLDVNGDLDLIALEEALRTLMTHHDALRSRFDRAKTQWTCELLETQTQPIEVEVLQSTGASSNLESQAAYLANSLNLTNGPMIRVGVVQSSDSAQVILCAHHLVVDAVSWWVLLEDLEDCYASIIGSRAVELPLKTTSFKHWSASLVAFANSQGAEQHVQMWSQQCSFGEHFLLKLKDFANRSSIVKSDSPETSSLNDVHNVTKVDSKLNSSGVDGDSNNSASHWQLCTVSLDLARTKSMMTEVTMNWRSQPQDVLLLALARTLASELSLSQLQFDVEAHGRESVSDEVDLLRTVGWFTSVFPVAVETVVSIDDTGEIWSKQLRHVRDVFRKIPNGGVSYGALKHLSDSDEVKQAFARHNASPVLLNYLGTWRKQVGNNTLFTIAEPLIATHSDDVHPRYLLEVNAVVFDDRLQIQLGFDARTLSSSAVQELAEKLLANLAQIVSYCANTKDTQLSATDFPSAALDQQDLDDLLAEFAE